MRSIIYSAITLILIIQSTLVLGSSWEYSKNVDGFTDETLHTALIRTDNRRIFAFARCDKVKFDLIFSLNEYIGSDKKYPIRYRIDKNKPLSRAW